MIHIVLTWLWAFLVSLFAVPSIIFVAQSKKLFDTPNKRSIHEQLIPRLGGVAIFAGFISALTIFGTVNLSIQELIAGCTIIFFIGVKDDLVVVSAFKKFFVQMLATGIVMVIGDLRITSFQGLFNIYALDPGTSYAFSFLVIIGITNAINLIDGLDGLAGTIILIVCIIFGFYFYIYDSPYVFVAFSLAGSIMGFLRYNIYKARIFMGDTGSLVCGFIIAVMAVAFVEIKAVPSAPAFAVAVLIIPIFDTLRVFTLRVLKGQSPFIPDKNHLHHLLLSLEISSLQIVSILVTFNLILVALIISFFHLGNTLLLAITFSTCIILSFILKFILRKAKDNA